MLCYVIINILRKLSKHNLHTHIQSNFRKLDMIEVIHLYAKILQRGVLMTSSSYGDMEVTGKVVETVIKI